MSNVSNLKRVKPTGKATKEQMAELKALAELPDDQVDLFDIPEITDWSGAVVGKFYRPVKVWRDVLIYFSIEVNSGNSNGG